MVLDSAMWGIGKRWKVPWCWIVPILKVLDSSLVLESALVLDSAMWGITKCWKVPRCWKVPLVMVLDSTMSGIRKCWKVHWYWIVPCRCISAGKCLGAG